MTILSKCQIKPLFSKAANLDKWLVLLNVFHATKMQFSFIDSARVYWFAPKKEMNMALKILQCNSFAVLSHHAPLKVIRLNGKPWSRTLPFHKWPPGVCFSLSVFVIPVECPWQHTRFRLLMDGCVPTANGNFHSVHWNQNVILQAWFISLYA